MKQQLLTATLLLAAASALAQGTITFGTTFTGEFIMPVFGPDPANNLVGLHGAPYGIAGVVPTNGTVAYGGPLLQGTGYVLQVWAGPTDATMQPVYTTTFRTANGNKLPAGLVNYQVNLTVPGVSPGQRAWYQIRVWNDDDGYVTTWDLARSRWGEIDAGMSWTVQSAPLGGADQNGRYWATPHSTDWTSFSTWFLVDGYVPAILSMTPLAQTVAAGSSASIRAVVNSTGVEGVYRWFFNKTNYLGTTTDTTLVLTNLQVQQSGAYFLCASNQWGQGPPFQPAMVSVLPWLSIDSARSLTLHGGVGVTFCIDYVNALGPKNAWVTLDTVTMTNNPQVYFDMSAIGQPARLYRLVQLP